METRRLRLRRVVVTLVLCATSGFIGYFVDSMTHLFENMFYSTTPRPLPDRPVVSSPSPAANLIAEILYDEPSKRYFFAVRNADNPPLVLDTWIHPEGGYHDPFFTLEWSKAGDHVYLTVDHDFGDDNWHFDYSVKDYLLTRK